MLKRWVKNERGSATIEFLSMIPLILLVMMIFWQFLVAGYAVIITQSAANEAAKIYSVTESKEQATEAANKIVSTSGDNLKLRTDYEIINRSSGSRDFTATVTVDMRLQFLPKKILGVLPPITFNKEISGKVLK
ncbi:pilus assembly protein [Bacillus sp. Bva_UNVM-123]|uniref:TadE/TadG family type IV pilus assembly protein n=1 Tax=Bacillus sp. Bva_UNVM-123 TaxID=2829798 RepID=UPI00391EEC29